MLNFKNNILTGPHGLSMPFSSTNMSSSTLLDRKAVGTPSAGATLHIRTLSTVPPPPPSHHSRTFCIVRRASRRMNDAEIDYWFKWRRVLLGNVFHFPRLILLRGRRAFSVVFFLSSLPTSCIAVLISSAWVIDFHGRLGACDRKGPRFVCVCVCVCVCICLCVCLLERHC